MSRSGPFENRTAVVVVRAVCRTSVWKVAVISGEMVVDVERGWSGVSVGIRISGGHGDWRV